jgi:hypothetical protein
VVGHLVETKRIRDALADQFAQEGRRIVFWHDPEREFEETLATLEG